MYDYKIVEQVSRKKKSMSGVLQKDHGNICLYFCSDGYCYFSGIYAGRTSVWQVFILSMDTLSQKDYEYTSGKWIS